MAVKPKILIIDTLYDDFIRSLPFDNAGTYEAELRKVLDRGFGTSDFYSRNLRELEWDAVDVICNHPDLQQMWAEENYSGQGRRGENILDLQIEHYNPDVIVFQDLNLTAGVNFMLERRITAAQCSCAIPDNFVPVDVIFSSFRHHVECFQRMGIRSVYLQLAFEPSVLSGDQPTRDIDISFVGGVGRDLHWRQGTDTLEVIAEAFRERFHWYGYGLDRLPADSALRACYRGEAWGKDMYSVYRRSRVVVNRHGEIAQGFANNLRMYEATGTGALLLTDNETDLFEQDEIVRYSSPADAVEKIRYYLSHEDERRLIAWKGQSKTLRDHTYTQRMKVVSETLKEMLCPANAANT